MKQFSYARPTSTAEALALSDTARTRYLAGGSNLVDLMKLGVEQPDLLVDVNDVLSHQIDDDGATIRIGAGVSNSDLAAHPAIRGRYPALTQAVLAGASGQLRNVATVGGNLLQRTRCSYFQDVTKPCNKRVPESGCPARTGEHHNLAVLGGSERCIATNPSDMAVALIALDAAVHVTTADGTQQVALTDFYVLPGEHPERETVLPPDAIISAVELPPLAFATTSRYVKVRERASYAFAIGSVAAALDVTAGVVADVRLAFGAIAPAPWRARRAEDALRGGELSEGSIRAALAAEFADAEPLTHNAYKIDLVTNLAIRTLTEIHDEAS